MDKTDQTPIYVGTANAGDAIAQERVGEEDVGTAYLLYSNQITLQHASRAAIKRAVDDCALPRSFRCKLLYTASGCQTRRTDAVLRPKA